MGVRGSGRRGVRQRDGRRRIGVKNELLDSNNLLAIAELLQLAEKGLDLLDEGFTLGIFQLAQHFLNDIVAILITHETKERALTPVVRRG